MEPTFTCDRCGYLATRKDYLMKHLKRKIACEPMVKDVPCSVQIRNIELVSNEKRNYNPITNTYDCNYCNKQYDTSSGKCVHVRSCEVKKAAKANAAAAALADKTTMDIANRDDVPNDVRQLIKQLQEQLQEQQLQKTTIATAVTTVNNINNINNNNIVTNNNVNITITNFGSEPINFSDEFMQHCLYLCQDEANLDIGTQNGITTLLKELHSPPANKNFRVKNSNQCLMLIHKDGRWLAESKNNVLEAMFNKGKSIMSKYKAKNKDRLYDEEPFAGMFEEIEEWLSTFDEDAPRSRQIREKIKGELFRNIILDNHGKNNKQLVE